MNIKNSSNGFRIGASLLLFYDNNDHVTNDLNSMVVEKCLLAYRYQR